MWINRLYLFCSSDDVDALRQIAVDATHNEADRLTFVPCGSGYYGCNTAITEQLRESLNSGVTEAISQGLINNTIYIARTNNSDGLLQSSYSLSQEGFGEFGGVIGQVFSWNEALNLL